MNKYVLGVKMEYFFKEIYIFPIISTTLESSFQENWFKYYGPVKQKKKIPVYTFPFFLLHVKCDINI